MGLQSLVRYFQNSSLAKEFNLVIDLQTIGGCIVANSSWFKSGFSVINGISSAEGIIIDHENRPTTQAQDLLSEQNGQVFKFFYSKHFLIYLQSRVMGRRERGRRQRGGRRKKKEKN